MNNLRKTKQKAWVVAVDMGYGHQRAAYPLKHLAYKNEIITVNTYPGIPHQDRRIWKESRKFYEFISGFKKTPLVGKKIFQLYDKLQAIPHFYPRRDLSKSNIQLRQIYRLMEKWDWGKHLITKLAKKPLPMINTFFIPAFMADFFNYPGDIYCVVTDTDISRAWVPEKPSFSRINYLAPNYRVVERLKLYGVQENRIFLSGFPLPMENIGGLKMNVLKKDLAHRIINLDPERKYQNLYDQLIKKYLGVKGLLKKSNHPLTLTFAVGGAGAQRSIGAEIVKSLKDKILAKEIKLILVAGIHNDVNSYFRKAARCCGLGKELGQGIEIIFAPNKDEYFKKFNEALRTTDILWTKPSELSFYCALGLPIVMSPPIGSQEIFNRKWLRTIGAAVNQYQTKYANEWLFDWVNSGWFAEAAMQGFVEAPKFGTFNIEKIIGHEFEKTKEPKMVIQY